MSVKKRVVIHSGFQKLPSFNYRPIILFTMFVCGLIIGVQCVNCGSQEFVSVLDGLYSASRESNAQIGYFTLILRSFAYSSLYVCATFILGLCAAGVPFLCLIPVIKGCVTGVCAALMYKSFGMTGLGYCSLIVFPGAAFMVSALIFCCGEAMRMSASIFSTLIKYKNDTEVYPIKQYGTRYVFFILVTLLAAVTDSVMFSAFREYFVFG